MISLGQRRRIASNYLLSRGEFIRNPLIEIDSCGRILSVESCSDVDRMSSTEFYAGVLFAGMVNMHCHLELSFLRGAITPKCGFSSFAAELAQKRDLFSPDQQIEAAQRADLEMRREGVVAVADIANGGVTSSVKAKSSIYYHTFVEHFGLRRHSVDYLNPLLTDRRHSLTPHSTYSVTDATFRQIALLGDAPLSIHFMETPSERELFEGHGAYTEWYRSAGFECDFLHYGSPAKRIVESVPATRSVILVHNTTVKREDVELVMNHFKAPVYWVLCPRSNDFISSLKPPVDLLRSMGAKICLGSDSLASNYSLSMLEEMRLLQGVPLCERLTWATANGAEALGLTHIGDIAVGKQPSINLLSGIDYQNMELTPTSRIETLIAANI